MKRLVKALLVATTIGVCAILVAASGAIPIRASSGHWGVTTWFLHFAMKRSVATWSLAVEAPPLEDPGLVLRGAGHYHTGCRPCHGSPEMQRPRAVQAMLPPPPYLPPTMAEWKPEELFSIVKHGVKLTGMPAWPTPHRDDEVWAVVAFLRRLPDLDAAAYQRLIHGEPRKRGDAVPLRGLAAPETLPRAVLESCARCHGDDGNGRGPNAFPRLAGQRVEYLYASMQAYARGTRHSGIMEPIAAGLTADEMRELARYYAGMEAETPAPAGQVSAPAGVELAAAIERGGAIARDGIPAQRVPACAECHGPGVLPRNPVYPVLAGQDAEYLRLQLELFKQEHRGGTAFAHLMRPVAGRLTPEQVRDVTLYYASRGDAGE